MDLRHMRQFVAVAEELHFGRAARRLNMMQPPLSQAIRKIELELNVDLFDRSTRVVQLTDAGRIFLVEARRALAQADLACKLTKRAAAKAAEIRVGLIGPALYRVLPELIVNYRTIRPEVEIRLLERTSAEQIRDLLVGDLDVGFVTATEDKAAGIETMIVERASFLAVVPANWEVAKKGTITFAELAEQPFILPPQMYRPRISEMLEMFRSRGLTPRVSQEATQINTKLSMIGVGVGCSIVPATAVLVRPPKVKFLRIEDLSPVRPWEIAMAWSSEHAGPVTSGYVEAVGTYLSANPHLLDPDAALEVMNA